MDQENTLGSTPDVEQLGGQMARATQSLADALASLDSQFAGLHAKIDRIVAAIEGGEVQASAQSEDDLRGKLAKLEKQNLALKAQSDTARRKTLSPVVSALLAKQGVEGDALIETQVVEKALAGLSIEQRIAVKAELARAGILT